MVKLQRDSGNRPTRSRRRRAVLAVAIALVGSSIGAFIYGRTLSGAAVLAETLSGARAFADSVERAGNAAPAESISTPDAVAELYLERLRLGLGSPFRLIDQVLSEESLDAAYRRRLALAMLARTLDGDAYQTDPAALQLIPPFGEGADPHVGAAHLALITAELAHDRDPRVGELAVRLAYRLASASGAVSRRAPEIATSVASQGRDRLLAMRDAEALLDAAARSHGDVIALLRLWRDNRRFAVERPVIAPLPARVERLAVAELPGVVARIERMATELQAGSDVALGDSGADRAAHRALWYPGLGLARRMAGVADVRDQPPQAPVSVIVAGYAPLIRRDAATAAEYSDRLRFVGHARNEEKLAAEFSLLHHGGRGDIPAAALAVLSAGVALRPYAQERLVQKGEAASLVRDAQSRFGITISFARTVLPAWRPYLVATLAQALTDFRRVLPAYDPRGLRVVFGETPLGERALALHDPVTRTIYFPATSSAGVMAHEFAHDLDWLAARRAYGKSGGYRTDRAVRQGANQIAGALRQMASAVRLDTVVGRPDAPSRPTEVFARNVDWFVSAALARDGRMNGFLSAAQDPLLIGYASATTPEAAREGGSATLRVLEGMTTLSEPVRAWFTANFGAGRRISAHEIVRQVLEAPVRASRSGAVGARAFEARGAVQAALGPASGASAWECLLDEFTGQAVDPGAARAAAVDAANARARGIVREWSAFARRYPDRVASRLRPLAGPPWRPELAAAETRGLRDAILLQAFGGRATAAPARTLAAADGLRALAGCARGR